MTHLDDPEIQECARCGSVEFMIEKDIIDGLDYYFVSCRNCLEVFGKVDKIC